MIKFLRRQIARARARTSSAGSRYLHTHRTHRSQLSSMQDVAFIYHLCDQQPIFTQSLDCTCFMPTDRNRENPQMWQHETFIHFGYITLDIIGCVDGKYEHNSADATCQDFTKIPLCSPLSLVMRFSRASRIASTTIVSSSRYTSLSSPPL